MQAVLDGERGDVQIFRSNETRQVVAHRKEAKLSFCRVPDVPEPCVVGIRSAITPNQDFKKMNGSRHYFALKYVLLSMHPVHAERLVAPTIKMCVCFALFTQEQSPVACSRSHSAGIWNFAS